MTMAIIMIIFIIIIVIMIIIIALSSLLGLVRRLNVVQYQFSGQC